MRGGNPIPSVRITPSRQMSSQENMPFRDIKRIPFWHTNVKQVMTYHSIKAITKTKTPLAGSIGDGTEYESEYDKPV